MNLNATLLGQMIAFGLFVWFCWKFVWPPLLAAMEERAKKIEQGLKDSEASAKKIVEAEEESKKMLTKAKNEAKKIMDNAKIAFQGENDADQSTLFAKITGKILDASDGSEDGGIEFAAQKAGTQTILARLRSNKFELLIKIRQWHALRL